MLHVGLTGNIAAGKSAVAALFQQWGATLIDADEIVYALQAPGTAVFEGIVHHFGPSVLAADGTLDRAALRAIVFADPARRAALNALVHPEVHRRRAALLAEARNRGDPLAVSVIPLLFETADPTEFDSIVLVDAPPTIRRHRLQRARGLTADEADRMIAAGAPAGPKRARSDYVIDNDADLATLERRAWNVWTELRARGGGTVDGTADETPDEYHS